ncbi:hypothetical protein FOB90_08770 [Mammaliicoccus fleurettii]|uniref:transposase family protein n=2 Tax=Staphylococcus TaxID=1279 RepID=UPI0012DEDE4F|nr:transposase family protein [Staphylococcus schleiferi]QGS46749.1 hypothetical protein FOB90_08770 [Mammaliicoccus fleurettii]
MTCPHCYHTNPNRIHKHGKRLSRITFLRFQEIAVYLNLLKQRFKCRVCGRTFTSKTNVVEDNCFLFLILKTPRFFKQPDSYYNNSTYTAAFTIKMTMMTLTWNLSCYNMGRDHQSQ